MTTRHGERARHAGARALRAGFTLIEMLAVIVIIGILMVVLLPRLTEILRHSDAKVTETNLQLIRSAIDQYEGRFGDYPPSQFQEKWGTPPNATNLGGEALVISLWSPDWGGADLSEDLLVNTDSDETKKSVTRFPSNSLFELKDSWGNPIAYFHHRDYGRTDTYTVIPDEAGDTESQVKAMINPKTKTYYEPNKFQLISAGLDGKFGTADDLTNFKRQD
jgi:prepilin-type N-terminal cleavage/methylation domain-containing protein